MDGTVPAGGDATTRIFISYRKADASGWAGRLYDRLAARFGAENVFFDEASLEAGAKWRDQLRSGSSSAAIFLALIGPQWAAIMAERAGGAEEDQVRAEVEAALRRDSQVREVIPALILGASMPRETELRSLGSVRQLLRRQAIELRPPHWEDDVEALIARIEEIAAAPPPPPPPSLPDPAPDPPPETPDGETARSEAPPPDQEHYDALVRTLLDGHSLVVPFLGPEANSSDRTEPWRDPESGYSPDGGELAAFLAAMLDPAPPSPELAKVSQNVLLEVGELDLFLTLRRALPSTCPPSSVHRFLAAYPSTMTKLGFADRYQLIVTTNYDDGLERAFEDAEEPFDLAVYVARGPNRGRFVHVPFDGEPQLIADANSYTGFPVDVITPRVERTVIMKVHGAVDSRRGPGLWRDNFVITEDDYIEYMRGADVESIVPFELLSSLRDYSHYLFLGHSIHDWSLRVFLKRIFGEHQKPRGTSWAIQRDPTALDRSFWQSIDVDVGATSLEAYVGELGESLARAAAARTKAGP
ncbi:MAG TPA: SIR2 family protein [Solirubrobacterales bacterium]|nr:SIR2 family protein [Solirubrobacterales bacterium]